MVPAGEGDRVVAAHRGEDRRRRRIATATVTVVGLLAGAVGAAWLLSGLVVPVGVGLLIGAVGGVVRYWAWSPNAALPEVIADDVSAAIVRDYVDEFDPNAVSSAFDS
ncbi:hypothetical protein EXE43_04355 [Halorubrum sp. SS5]|nr:hypothetical protein EXE43_04355 [Halorubrum sp. SS5]